MVLPECYAMKGGLHSGSGYVPQEGDCKLLDSGVQVYRRFTGILIWSTRQVAIGLFRNLNKIWPLLGKQYYR